jgi:hypothetical protein
MSEQTNLARLLRAYEGDKVVIEWVDGLKVLGQVDTFSEAEDNADGVDSILLDVVDILGGLPKGSLGKGSILEIKQEEDVLSRISTVTGHVIWERATSRFLDRNRQ